MVFKKRALGFSANISRLSSKALFAYTAACIYWREKKKGKKKTYTNRSFWHNQLVHGNPVLAYYYQFALHWIKISFTDKLIHDGFWPEGNTVIMSESL